MITNYGFTQEQLASIYEVIKNIKQINDSQTSLSKIDGIQYYADNQKNFYVSYCKSTYTENGLISDLIYTCVNPFGAIINLNEIYDSTQGIVSKLSKCQIITVI
jgi:hypothetical protein